MITHWQNYSIHIPPHHSLPLRRAQSHLHNSAQLLRDEGLNPRDLVPPICFRISNCTLHIDPSHLIPIQADVILRHNAPPQITPHMTGVISAALRAFAPAG